MCVRKRERERAGAIKSGRKIDNMKGKKKVQKRWRYGQRDRGSDKARRERRVI